jgi:hypothetical protein
MSVKPGSYRNLQEAFWLEHLTVGQNLHFYERLPTISETYRDNFRRDPIETFQHHKTISVLLNNPDHAGQVFVDTASRKRAFGNVYVLNDTIIFKGSCLMCFFFLSNTLLDVRGRLEGESIVGASIHDIPNLWCIEESPSLTSHPMLSPNQDSPSLTVTVTQITSATGRRIRDWREPIRRMLQSRDASILFTDKPPGSSGSIPSAGSSASTLLS